MGATRLQLEIMSHTEEFRRRFRVNACTDAYIQFVALTRYDCAIANVYRTSTNCYRVMWYHSHLQVRKFSEYKSFRTISELCVYLETLSRRLV